MLFILPVHDAVTLVFQPDAANAVFAGITIIAVEKIRVGLQAGMASDQAIPLGGQALVGILRRHAGKIAIHALAEAFACCEMGGIFTAFQVISLDDIVAVVEVISGDIFASESVIVLDDFFPEKLMESFLCNTQNRSRPRIERCLLFFILFL
jgi:hypothetical protein